MYVEQICNTNYRFLASTFDQPSVKVCSFSVCYFIAGQVSGEHNRSVLTVPVAFRDNTLTHLIYRFLVQARERDLFFPGRGQ